MTLRAQKYQASEAKVNPMSIGVSKVLPQTYPLVSTRVLRSGAKRLYQTSEAKGNPKKICVLKESPRVEQLKRRLIGPRNIGVIKNLPRKGNIAHTKLLELGAQKYQTSKASEAKGNPKNTEDSVAVVLRMANTNVLVKLWEMYKYNQLDEMFRQVLMPIISHESRQQRLILEVLFQEEDYESSKSILQGNKRLSSLYRMI
jgi:hypothetical protein